MTKDEERALGVRIAARDLAARDELIEAYFPLARKIALMRPCAMVGRCGERTSAAMLALVEAANRYDPAAHGNALFSTFARVWIHGYCRRQCEVCGRTLKPVDPHDMREVVDHRSSESPVRGVEVLAVVSEVLTPHEQEVVRLHVGLGGGESHTFRRLASRYGVTRQCVAQWYYAALAKMRVRLTVEGEVVR